MARGRGNRHQSRSSSTVVLVLLVLTVMFLVLLCLGMLSLPIGFEDQKLFIDRIKLKRGAALDVKSEGEIRGEKWTEVLSWEPRAFIYHNFLSKEECKYLINLAKPHLRKSTVVDSETGKSMNSSVRTSSGMFLTREQDVIVGDIEKRIADFSHIPIENGEGLQVLHYEVDQKYEPHYDFFIDEYNIKNGGQRIATLLMYLSDVEEGGETVFPAAEGNFSKVPDWNELMSECGKKGLSVKPRMGDALLFWSMNPDATVDPSSLHGSCPVIKGDKWSAAKPFGCVLMNSNRYFFQGWSLIIVIVSVVSFLFLRKKKSFIVESKHSSEKFMSSCTEDLLSWDMILARTRMYETDCSLKRREMFQL